MRTKDIVIVIVILLIAGIFSSFSYFNRIKPADAETDIASFPKVVGEWQGEDILISERDYELLETRNLIMRDYTNPGGESVNLYIIYSQDNRKVAHPPEICLQGGGATVTDKTAVQVSDNVTATRMVLERDTSRQLVLYWYKLGEENTNFFLGQQLRMEFGRIFGKKFSIAMIRVMTVLEDGKEEEALERLKEFSLTIMPLLQKYTP